MDQTLTDIVRRLDWWHLRRLKAVTIGLADSKYGPGLAISDGSGKVRAGLAARPGWS